MPLLTAMLNALRNVPRRDAATAAAVAERAAALLEAARAAGGANATTYTCALALLAEQGDVAGVSALWAAMEADRVAPSAAMYRVLATACQEGGLLEQAERFREQLAAWEAARKEATKAARK